MISYSTTNVLITVLVLLFVTLALAQRILFEESKWKKGWNLPTAITYLGLGAAFYALFLSRLHFSVGGSLGLIAAVIVIVFVGGLLIKTKKNKHREVNVPASVVFSDEDEEETEELHLPTIESGNDLSDTLADNDILESDIKSPAPDPMVWWCGKCYAHTKRKNHVCRRCQSQMWCPEDRRLTARIFGWITVVSGGAALALIGWMIAGSLSSPSDENVSPWVPVLILLCAGGVFLAVVGTLGLVWHLNRYLYREWQKWATRYGLQVDV